MIKVGFIHLGCAKNQIDSELMLSLLRSNNCLLEDEYCDADVVIINTCGFIESAKVEAIENIVEVIALKNEGRVGGIVVAGCLSQRYKSEIAEQFPEVDCFLGTGSYKSIVKAVENAYNQNKYLEFAPREAHIIEGDRIITTPLPSAYIKISEGCDNCCSYCAIPLIRGKFRSRTIESIIDEATHLAEIGVKELIVIAQDTTRYGEDIYGKRMLPELLQKLADIKDFKWIRVMYLYPDKITDKLLDVISENENIVNYIEMPIQHASGDILKAMNRSGDQNALIKTIAKIRAKLDGVVIRTTVMVGFPGETERDFEILCDFLKNTTIEKIGAFIFSPEENTPATEFENQIDKEIGETRYEAVMDLAETISINNLEKMQGKTITVLVEGYDKYIKNYFGRSYMDAPEIDGKVFFTSEIKIANGDFVEVTIDDCDNYDLYGKISIK